MIEFFKKLFGIGKKEPSTKWRCIYIRGDTNEKIDLGEVEGTEGEAMLTAYERQMVWFFKSGIRHPVFGHYGVEPLN